MAGCRRAQSWTYEATSAASCSLRYFDASSTFSAAVSATPANSGRCSRSCWPPSRMAWATCWRASAALAIVFVACASAVRVAWSAMPLAASWRRSPLGEPFIFLLRLDDCVLEFIVISIPLASVSGAATGSSLDRLAVAARRAPLPQCCRCSVSPSRPAPDDCCQGHNRAPHRDVRVANWQCPVDRAAARGVSRLRRGRTIVRLCAAELAWWHDDAKRARPRHELDRCRSEIVGIGARRKGPTARDPHPSGAIRRDMRRVLPAAERDGHEMTEQV